MFVCVAVCTNNGSTMCIDAQRFPGLLASFIFQAKACFALATSPCGRRHGRSSDFEHCPIRLVRNLGTLYALTVKAALKL
eukprot:m.199958 g.199958  ORF g.199958 m.199958 type:complete len:80 (+) comp10661_c3_seq12:286-525(+)